MSFEAFFLANFVVSCAILTAALRRIGFFRPAAVLLGALAGALGAALTAAGLLRQGPSAALTLAGLSSGIALIGRRPAVFLRGLLWCAILTALTAGLMSFIEIWFGISSIWITLIPSAMLFAFAFMMPEGSREAISGESILLRISTRMGQTEVLALIDTGNRLHEPLSGLPVVIVTRECLTGLLDPVCLDADAPLPPGFRLVRYRVLGSDGALRCFRPARLDCQRGRKWLKTPDMWIGIYNGNIPGHVEALAPPFIRSGC